MLFDNVERRVQQHGLLVVAAQVRVALLNGGTVDGLCGPQRRVRLQVQRAEGTGQRRRRPAFCAVASSP